MHCGKAMVSFQYLTGSNALWEDHRYFLWVMAKICIAGKVKDVVLVQYPPQSSHLKIYLIFVYL